MSKALIALLSTIIVDWTVKSLPKGDFWVPHYTERPWIILPICLVLVSLGILLMNKRAGYIAGGIAMGGYCANMIDLQRDGVVWNMIPIPWTDGFTCNVADFAIVGGGIALLVLSLTSLVRWAEVPAKDLIPSDEDGTVPTR